jgi:hypothetical protein
MIAEAGRNIRVTPIKAVFQQDSRVPCSAGLKDAEGVLRPEDIISLKRWSTEPKAPQP